ncbi:homologous-pairing protein 2 homolog [Anoplophora glabripennis]|uniref:homologous-pairing protein 2 homolog n=1 Tax=Anoplophora glabripennis TaxID=217634 RepID=UPI000874F8C8|nr:homologous-pairing protein 2 homolog [Anoplophora glabripennis]XP_018564531.1 homologous-pairing protein 2 homolog [Anoplophora glabripennis]
MAKQAVLNFLENHIRPFSVNEIQQGVKGDFGKSAIQKALDSLVEQQKVKEKIYGKQKVYCLIQQNDATEAELREKLLEMDRDIKEKELQLKEISDELKKTVAQITEVEGKISLGEALNKKFLLEKELEEIKNELEKYSATETVCPNVKKAADQNYEKMLNQYKKRKRICLDVLNSILENYLKSKKILFEDIGIETDEDADFHVDKL